MPTRREQKLDLKRREILKSAASAFKRKGYHRTTMSDISRQLLMTQGSLYYYFKSKAEILYACHQYSLNLLLLGLRRIGASSDPPPEKLRALITHHVTVITDELEGSAIHLDFQALPPKRLNQVVKKRDQYEEGVRRLIQEGISQGFFTPVDPKIAAFALLGALNWMAKWFSPEGPQNSAQIGQAFAELFLRALDMDTSRSQSPPPV